MTHPSTSQKIGGPIAYQPIMNLALICRYLTGPELIVCYRTNHLLSAAASHPLTFQQETKVGVITDLSQCRVYANGPTAVFRTSQQMQKAFQSRLFKHFRVVHMNSRDGQQLKEYLEALTHPNTPPLRAITMSFPTGYKNSPTKKKDPINSTTTNTNDESNEIIIDYSNAPALKYLIAVHLIDACYDNDTPDLDRLIRFLPPSTEILQLTLTGIQRITGEAMKALVDRLLLPNNQIKQLIVESSGYHTTIDQLVELGRLHEQSRNIASLTIHFNVPLRQRGLESSKNRTELSQLKLTQVETIQVKHVQLSSAHECYLSELLPIFPRVKRLTISSMDMSIPFPKAKLRAGSKEVQTADLLAPIVPIMPQTTSSTVIETNAVSTNKSNLPILMYPIWPTTVQQSLQDLRIKFDSSVSDVAWAPHFYCFILFLIQAKLINLTHLELDVDSAVPVGGSLRELFESMPQLTRLSLNNITVDKLDDFAFAPNLVNLYSLSWPTTLPKSLAHIFPSLQTLSVPYATETTPTIHSELIKTAPNLRRLKWKRLPWIHPKDINNAYATIELERTKRMQAQAEADLKEREERLRLVQEKGVRAMASIDAIAPPTDELKNFFSRVNVATKIETAEEISARLRRQHLTPTKSAIISNVISNEPFVFTPPTNTNAATDSTNVFTTSQLTSPNSSTAFSFNSTHFSLTSPSATTSTNSSTQPTPTSTLEPPNPFSLLTPQPSLSINASVFNTPTSTSTSSMGVGGFSSHKKVGGRKSTGGSGHRTTSIGHPSTTHSTAAATTTTSPAFVFQTNSSTVDVSTITASVNNPFAPPSFENSSSTSTTATASSFTAAAFSFPVITPKQ